MNRCSQVLLTAFRVVQLLLSLLVLGIGAYITSTMYSMSESAHRLEESIETLVDDVSKRTSLENGLNVDDAQVNDALKVMSKILVPVLKVLQGTPARAIVITVVGLWSIIFIVYLFFANRAKSHPRLNKRAIRVMLELATLSAWIVAIICAILLALQYGVMAISGGIEVKLAMTIAKEVVAKALEEAIEDSSSGQNALQVMDMIGDMITVGGLSIAAAGAAFVCGIVSMVSLIVACCTKTKHHPQFEDACSVRESAQLLSTGYTDKSPVTYITGAHPSPTGAATPTTPDATYNYSYHQYNERQTV